MMRINQLEKCIDYIYKWNDVIRICFLVENSSPHQPIRAIYTVKESVALWLLDICISTALLLLYNNI